MTEVYAFQVFIKGREQFSSVVNAHSRGQAKRQFLLDLDGCWPDVRYIDLRARKDGGPLTGADFLRNAIYRGLPDARCGDRVRVGAGTGAIVGHNGSANFDVLFDADSLEYAGLRLNVHPSSVSFLSGAQTPSNTQESEGD